MSSRKHAFSLSKDEVSAATPPGTTPLVEHDAQAGDHIHLIPPPTRSGADPLTWSKWRKYTVLLSMSLFAFIASFGSAAIAPAIPILQYQLVAFQEPLHGPPNLLPYGTLSHLVAVNVLLIGVSNIIWVPIANTFGRRPVLIASMLLALVCSVWGGVANSFSSLLAARALQGAGFGPADTVSPQSVGEVFFVHQRGRAMAIYTIFLSGGSFLGGLAGAYIAGNLGYKYIFWVVAAMLAGNLVLEIFLVPETLFDREAALLADRTGSLGETVAEEKKAGVQTIEHVGPAEQLTVKQSLRVGVYRGSLLQNFFNPWRSLAFPGTWVVMLHYGGLLGGLVTIATVGPQFLAMPPYLWGNNVGLLNLGAIVGGIVGFAATYFAADRLLTRRAKKESHGFAEPETRLPALFPALFIATTGIWTFGFCAANPSPKAWVGMVVGFGMVGFGITQIPSIGFNYLIDSYRPISADCFVMTTISRSVVSFAWTFFVGGWVQSAGPALPFGIFGMIMAIFALLTIPLWIYGKRLRIATAGLLPDHGN